MSQSIKQSVIAIALGICTVAGSSSVMAADQVSLNQLTAYNVSQRVAEVQFVLDAQLHASVYNSANGQMQNDVAPEGRRPVIKMTELDPEQPEQE